MKLFGSSEWMSRIPNGCSRPSIGTARLLRTPITRSAGGIENRPSVSQSAMITCRPDSSAAPAWELRAADARRLPSVPWISAPASICSRRPSRPTSQMQAASMPSISTISATASSISAADSPCWSAWLESRATVACWATARRRSSSAILRSVMS